MDRTDIVVTSLAEYIEKVSNLLGTVFYSGTTSLFPIYRGQADSAWDLNPAVYRDNRFKYEKKYICEMERIVPEAFSGMNRIDKLIKMQHYGLPTRLLDFSKNSLVALYFACNKESDKDGAVYEVHAMPMLHQDTVLVSVVMKYLFEYGNEFFDPDKFVAELSEEDYPGKFFADFKSRDGIYQVLSSTHGIYPMHTNERVRNQDGVFVLAGMDIKETEMGCYTFFPRVQTDIKTIWPESRRILIPKESKEKIMRSLDRIGINEKSLFPGLESAAKSVMQHVAYQQVVIHGKATKAEE